MLLRLKLFISYLLSKCKEIPDVKQGKKKIVIALAANYGNLGDVAITLAQKQYLTRYFPNYEVLEFMITDTFCKMKALKDIIVPGDIITIVGGGNMGDMYDDIEFARQFIIKNFPENKIVIFPQTISFSDSFIGNVRLYLAKKIYNRHKDLKIFVREKFSYEKYKDIFFEKIVLVPDIVMSMKRLESLEIERSGIVLCFRQDKEDSMDSNYKAELIARVESIFDVKKRDTHVGETQNLNQLYEKLDELIKEFQYSSVVITDRLHGMILSYISHTPCVAFWGNNYKILGCWEWLQRSNYIRLIDYNGQPSIDDVISCVKELSRLTSDEKHMVDLEEYFYEIYESLTQ
ncbi:MAG: polysaccharide pyruvyl transferase family protein [Thomasclavelia sp.]|uniref:polysaccharide pyruvyl transferase family protein n=1 Tax=Thomasclavelia sp. TaxID=3025757 RepID=UPI0039A11915